jgi:peptidoglycan/xylan/chitin deacetylase (PgdA/CDA1 family)
MVKRLRRVAKRAIRFALTDLRAIRVLRPGYQGLGTIFMLHRVAVPGERFLDLDFVCGSAFLDDLLGQVRRWGWDIVSLDEVRRRLTDGGPERPFVCFTFDDGYRDNLSHALPVFRKHDAPMAVYLTSGLLDHAIEYWWGALEEMCWEAEALEIASPSGAPRQFTLRTREQKWEAYELITKWVHEDLEGYLPKLDEALARHHISIPQMLTRDVLTWDQARELARDPLVTIGSHSIGHHRLAQLDAAHAEGEMRDDRARLERELGLPITHFAYPYGNPGSCGEREFQLASKLGFTTAVTTRYGNVMTEHAQHLTALPRQLMGAANQTLASVRDCLRGTSNLLARRPRVMVA